MAEFKIPKNSRGTLLAKDWDACVPYGDKKPSDFCMRCSVDGAVEEPCL